MFEKMPKLVSARFSINTQSKIVIKNEMLGYQPLCPSHIWLMPNGLGFPGHSCGIWVPKFPLLSWQSSVNWDTFRFLTSHLRLTFKSTVTGAVHIWRMTWVLYEEWGLQLFFPSSKYWTSITIALSATSEKAAVNNEYLCVNLDVLLSHLCKARYTLLTSGNLKFKAHPNSRLDIFRLMVGTSPSRSHLLTVPSIHSSQIHHPVSCLGGALAPTAQLLRTFYLFYLYLSRLYLFAEAMFKGDHLFQVFPGKPGHKSSGPLPPFPCLLVHSACGAFVGSTWSRVCLFSQTMSYKRPWLMFLFLRSQHLA